MTHTCWKHPAGDIWKRNNRIAHINHCKWNAILCYCQTSLWYNVQKAKRKPVGKTRNGFVVVWWTPDTNWIFFLLLFLSLGVRWDSLPAALTVIEQSMTISDTKSRVYSCFVAYNITCYWKVQLLITTHNFTYFDLLQQTDWCCWPYLGFTF